MRRWIALGAVAVVAAFAFAAAALSVADGWRPAGGNGVPWIEALVRDDPRTRVDDYVAAIASGDRERALARWPMPERGYPDAIDALRDRRAEVTDTLLAARPGGHRIVDLQWWSTCCEPHPVTDGRAASAARITVAFDGMSQRYVFDVRVAAPGESFLDEVARRWRVTDIYRFGDEPLLLRWVATEHGSMTLGSYRPPNVEDCGRSAETAASPYDAAARECVWSAYSRGRPAKWTVMLRTTEGDPVRVTVTAQPTFIVVTRDMTADRWSAPGDRRLWIWQCRTMAKRPWATDTSRYSFDVSGCEGDGRSVSVP